MTIDELRPLLCDYRLVIDWPMPIDANQLTRHRLSSIDGLIFRSSVSSIVQALSMPSANKAFDSRTIELSRSLSKYIRLPVI